MSASSCRVVNDFADIVIEDDNFTYKQCKDYDYVRQLHFQRIIDTLKNHKVNIVRISSLAIHILVYSSEIEMIINAAKPNHIIFEGVYFDALSIINRLEFCKIKKLSVTKKCTALYPYLMNDPFVVINKNYNLTRQALINALNRNTRLLEIDCDGQIMPPDITRMLDRNLGIYKAILVLFAKSSRHNTQQITSYRDLLHMIAKYVILDSVKKY